MGKAITSDSLTFLNPRHQLMIMMMFPCFTESAWCQERQCTGCSVVPMATYFTMKSTNSWKLKHQWCVLNFTNSRPQKYCRLSHKMNGLLTEPRSIPRWVGQLSARCFWSQVSAFQHYRNLPLDIIPKSKATPPPPPPPPPCPPPSVLIRPQSPCYPRPQLPSSPPSFIPSRPFRTSLTPKLSTQSVNAPTDDYTGLAGATVPLLHYAPLTAQSVSDVLTSQRRIFVNEFPWWIRDDAKSYCVFQNQKVVLKKYGHIPIQTIKHKSCNPIYLTGVSNPLSFWCCIWPPWEADCYGLTFTLMS